MHQAHTITRTTAHGGRRLSVDFVQSDQPRSVAFVSTTSGDRRAGAKIPPESLHGTTGAQVRSCIGHLASRDVRQPSIQLTSTTSLIPGPEASRTMTNRCPSGDTSHSGSKGAAMYSFPVNTSAAGPIVGSLPVAIGMTNSESALR